MTAVPDQVLELLQRLKAMTVEAGCTPAEAANAAARLHAMLSKYQLDLADIAAADPGEPVVKEFKGSGYSRTPTYCTLYAQSIAEGFGCRLLYSPRGWTFVGFRSDALVAAFYVETTLARVQAEARRQAAARRLRGSDVGSFTKAFVVSAGAVVYQRLREKAQALVDGDGRAAALVPLKAKRVDEFFDAIPAETGPPVRFPEDAGGTRAGEAYGQTMDITDGLPRPADNHALAGG